MDISRQLDFLSHTDRGSEDRLAFFVEMMRELSSQTDPQEMVHAYGRRMEQVVRRDRYISLSRRDLEPPLYRVTRSSVWDEANTDVNPWRNRETLPIFDSGLLGDLLYKDVPTILDDFEPDPSDPGFLFLQGMRSLVALPLYDKGVATNMVIMLSRKTAAFPREGLPEQVWMSNLFGRATHNLVLRDELQRAYDAVDRELRTVADIQRSLLPTRLPDIPTLDIAAHYQTSKRAGGDYYDFFQLPGGKWGLLLADVSGHGTPAAVLMAVTHSIAHTLHGDPDPPSALLAFINRHLTARYTNDSGKFVTAFYGIYDPSTRTLRYSSAGHCPPRVCRGNGGPFETMEEGAGLPLGIDADAAYYDVSMRFAPGDTIAFYTDGITEARGEGAEMFGTDPLDDILGGCGEASAEDLVAQTLKAVDTFTSGRPATDDRTLLFVKVR